MSEEIDLNNVAVTVMWLVSTIKDDFGADSKTFCNLNDYSEFEMYQLNQARDSEDRF